MTTRRHPRLLSLVAAMTEGRRDLRLAGLTEREVDWAVATGLGPVLHYATSEDPARERCPTWETVLSADLTARIINGGQHAAMEEILDHCRSAAPITLLKGIAFASQIYPEPHLRTMRDIDLLVAREDYAAVELALFELGYQQQQPQREGWYHEHHHHGPPLWHPETDNWIEVHWGLVPPAWPQSREPAFQPATVADETLEVDFHGRQTSRLSCELQLLHLASHWRTGQVVLGGMLTLIDAALLLANPTLDWTKVVCWLDGPRSAIDLHFLATFLGDRALAEFPEGISDQIRGSKPHPGSAHVRLLHRLIDRHMVEGRKLRWPLSEAGFKRLWGELLQPNPAWRNYARLFKYLLPGAPSDPAVGKKDIPE